MQKSKSLFLNISKPDVLTMLFGEAMRGADTSCCICATCLHWSCRLVVVHFSRCYVKANRLRARSGRERERACKERRSAVVSAHESGETGSSQGNARSAVCDERSGDQLLASKFSAQTHWDARGPIRTEGAAVNIALGARKANTFGEGKRSVLVHSLSSGGERGERTRTHTHTPANRPSRRSSAHIAPSACRSTHVLMQIHAKESQARDSFISSLCAYAREREKRENVRLSRRERLSDPPTASSLDVLAAASLRSYRFYDIKFTAAVESSLVHRVLWSEQ